MKRRFIKVIAVVFVIACAFAFSSCGHEHVFGEWSYSKLPTCTEAGVKSRMCLECEITEELPADPLGHDEIKHEAVAATCTEKGNEAYVTCSRCDYTTFKEIDALGHDEIKHEAVAATCTEKGNEAYVTCSRCDYTTFKEIDALGHDEIRHKAVSPTCTKEGNRTYFTCSRCDYTTYKAIPAKGHYVVIIPAKEATCVKAGKTEGSYCGVCKVTLQQQKNVPATGKHIPVVFKGVAPTCTKTGRTDSIICEGCNSCLVRPQNIDPTGHSFKTLYGKPPTCTENGISDGVVCETCGLLEVEQKVLPPRHSCKQGICTVCGTEDYTDPDQYASRVCYDALLQHPNGEQLQKLYDLVYNEARMFHLDYSLDAESFYTDQKSNGFAPGTIGISHLKLVQSDLDIVRNAFKNDNPIFYWFVNIPFTGYLSNGGQVSKIRLVVEFDYFKGSDRKQYNMQIAEKIKYYTSIPKKGTSKYEIALCYYDAIIETISYAYEAIDKDTEKAILDFRWTQNIVGAFCKDRTVCSGYGKAFGLLLNFSGIESRTVVGYTSPDVTHLWTLAKMDDGNWYWFDPTWDDEDKNGAYGYYIKYNYFCVNDTQKVNWLDAFAINVAMSSGTKNFLDQRDIDETRLSGSNKNYYLPERSPVEFSSDEILELRDTFTADGMTFALSGSGKVRLVGLANTLETLVIPDKVSYRGVEYTVDSVGYMASSGLFDCTRSITNGYCENVVIPNTVKYISARAISSENVAVNIFFEGTRAEWSNIQPGGNFTAKSKVYYYSDACPTAWGNYWHYVNGVATPW
ncbi:MAG: hypothetical protein IJF74_08450 [Clostridia bacterium]|nr:hypothetical protein [Clostridia bacterium]